MRHRQILFAALTVALLASAFSTLALAQTTPPKVLEDNQVTEKNLIDALTPSADELEGIRTRSLRVAPSGGQVAGNQAGTATAATIAPRRDVSLLVTFVTNSATLTKRAQKLLDVVGRALKTDQLAALKFTVNVSFGSSSVSPMTGTLICCVTVPGAKVSIPLTAV